MGDIQMHRERESLGVVPLKKPGRYGAIAAELGCPKPMHAVDHPHRGSMNNYRR
jgi:hypothetical protein